MTQTTDPRPDQWRAPWPAPTGTPTWPTPSAPPAPPAVPPATPPAGPPRSRDRRPGWAGVVAVGAGAALLSSLLTAGVVTALDDDAAATGTASSAATSGGALAPPVTTDTTNAPNWGSVAAAVEPSVVSVQVSAGQSGGEGSGIILDTQGRVLTNNHVIAAAADGGEIRVVLSDGRTYPATIVGRDPSTDLAVIRVQDPPADLRPATLGDSSTVKVGDPVMALGNPLGLSDTATTGIVSAVDRPVTTSAAQGQGGGGEAVVTNAIQTDAAVNPGNSGGALVDSRGRVIGVTSSIATLGASLGGQSGSIGLGFAIPVNAAKDVADQLVADGTADHAFLGVTLGEDTVSADGATRQAAVLQSVTAGGPAADAGLREGDAVTAIDREAVSGADSLVAQIRERRPGSTAELTVVRDGSSRQVQVTLGTRPATTP